MSHYAFRPHTLDSDSGEEEANALLFHPLGESLNPLSQTNPNVDFRYAPYPVFPPDVGATTLHTSAAAQQQDSFQTQPRPQLPQLNTDFGATTMRHIPTHNSHSPHAMPSWSAQQLEDMMYPGASQRPLVDYDGPEIFVETAPHLPPSAYDSSPSMLPFDRLTFDASPTTPNFPSPSSSSGCYSSSPFGPPQPLTPVSVQAPGNSPQFIPSPIPHSPTLYDDVPGAIWSNAVVVPGSPSPPKDVPAPFVPADQAVLGPFIPQRLYRPHTSSDRRRYVEEVKLEAAITFELQNPPQAGISLRDALTSRYMRLGGRDDLMFVNRGPSISIRLQWEGYQPWSRQIPTRDFRSPPGPITRSKLAKNVAKSVARFIDEHQGRPVERDADPRWQVGTGLIELDDLVLVSLHHVSMGSWQANLRLARPLVWA